MGKVARSTQNFTSSKIVIAARPPLRRGRTSSVTASPCHLPLEGKAWVRIKILCQNNVGNAKSNFDHRNSYFAATLAAGATIGMQTSRQCPPQARRKFHLIENCHCGSPALSRGRTSSVACRRHLPLKGKAWVRIKILCQHNAGSVKHCRYNFVLNRQRTPIRYKRLYFRNELTQSLPTDLL